MIYIDDELFKVINGYEKYMIGNNGNILTIKTNKIKKIDNYLEYSKITLSDINYKKKNFAVHRLVAEAFIPNPLNKEYVNHINGNKKDNRVDNLEWLTPSENTQHAYNTGLTIPKKGEHSSVSKLTNKEVLEIYYAEGMHIDISCKTVQRIKHKKGWKHLLNNLQNIDIVFSHLKEIDLKNNFIKNKTNKFIEYNKKKIKGFDNYLIDINGNVYNTNTKKYLKPTTNKHGYLKITLSKNCKPYYCLIHRLVALAFIDNPNSKKIINHKNGIKLDNNVKNLEWVTTSENTKHAWDNGLIKNIYGEEKSTSKLKEIDIVEIFYSKLNAIDLSIKYNISKEHVRLIKRGGTWKHITKLLK